MGKANVSAAPTMVAVVPGVIWTWYGAVAAIPSGWALCDGTKGTPDLRGRFVVGAGGAYSVGMVGGEAAHTLTVSEMPGHDHSFAIKQQGSYASGSGWPAVDLVDNKEFKRTIQTGNHQPHNNLPPYYALCYIMKL